MFSDRNKLTVVKYDPSDIEYPEYARQCIDIVEHITTLYVNNGTIFPDEIKLIFKEHGLRL